MPLQLETILAVTLALVGGLLAVVLLGPLGIVVLAVAVLLSVVFAGRVESGGAESRQEGQTVNCEDCGAPTDPADETCEHCGGRLA